MIIVTGLFGLLPRTGPKMKSSDLRRVRRMPCCWSELQSLVQGGSMVWTLTAWLQEHSCSSSCVCL